MISVVLHVALQAQYLDAQLGSMDSRLATALTLWQAAARAEGLISMGPSEDELCKAREAWPESLQWSINEVHGFLVHLDSTFLTALVQAAAIHREHFAQADRSRLVQVCLFMACRDAKYRACF